MNRPYIVSLFLLFGLIIFSSSTIKRVLRLDEAIQQSAISATITGNDKSTHYYEPVYIHLENKRAEELDISIPSGLLLLPEKATEQTLMVTQDVMVRLEANASKTFKVKAMCIEPTDNAGTQKSVYDVAMSTNDTLVKLANYISTQKYFTACGQKAIWTFIGKNSLADIYGPDSLEEQHLRRYLNQIAGMPMPQQAELTSYRNNYYAQPEETLSGYFQFGFNIPYDVQIAMFDTAGILVRELFNAQAYMPPQNHKITYQFDFHVYTDDKYYIKLILDNEIVTTRTVNAKAFRDAFNQQLEEGR